MAWSRRRRRSGPARPSSVSKPSSPTSCGSPTSPITVSPISSTSRSSPGSTIIHATPCRSQLTCASRASSSCPPSVGPVSRHGAPASTLTDNAMVFTTRLSGGKGGRNGLESELRRLGIVQKNSRPNHPTTCGKVERFQQTLKTWLRAQPDQPATIAELQTLLDRFVDIYNHQRPHRSLSHSCTPAAAYTTRPKAAPRDRHGDTHFRVRHDRRRQRWLRHPAHRRRPAPHRHRPRPHRNPHRPAHRRLRRAHHPRRHRRDPPTPHHRPHPPLPRHRPTPRPTNPKNTTTRTLMQVRAVRDVLRHHTALPTGFEPAHCGLEGRCSIRTELREPDD